MQFETRKPDMLKAPSRGFGLIVFSKLRFSVPVDVRTGHAIAEALRLEEESGRRCKMSTKLNGELEIIFASHDVVSLRAAINTNLRLVSSSLRSIKAAEMTDERKIE